MAEKKIIITQSRLASAVLEVLHSIIEEMSSLLKTPKAVFCEEEVKDEFKLTIGKCIYTTWTVVLNLLENSKTDELNITSRISSTQREIEKWFMAIGEQRADSIGIFYTGQNENKFNICSSEEFARWILRSIENINESIGQIDWMLNASKIPDSNKLDTIAACSAIMVDIHSLQCLVYLDHPNLITDPIWHEIIKDLRFDKGPS